MSRQDIERCLFETNEGRVLLDEEAHVLEFPVRPSGEAPDGLRNILDAVLARPGRVLVQSPFDPDSYEDAFLASQTFALEKHLLFSHFCMHLGASEVRCEEIQIKKGIMRWTFDATASVRVAEAGITTEQKKKEELRSRMSLHDEFSGASRDLQAAANLLRRKQLWSDGNMRSLLEMRAESDRLLTRRLELNLSTEAQSNLSVVGRLKGLIPKFAKLDADYEREISEQYEYGVTVTVRF